ncbi:hypothetical protein GQ44DRAFT_291319 [Phaeosphaeriaceae sp. PMI808]|nr:hypothetical protein GQ44DRAFT_291319 [Phaeosphaeriaceae sp. PMI808]
MLNEQEDDGFLIDFDLAIKIDREEASGAPGMTGTKVFMAIGALNGEPHSFSHDLESFFWVYFWVCSHARGPSSPGKILKENERWNFMKPEELAALKLGTIFIESMFEKAVHKSCTDWCKPLLPYLKKLREVVFPNGRPIEAGTSELYNQVKSVLEDGIQKLKAND